MTVPRRVRVRNILTVVSIVAGPPGLESKLVSCSIDLVDGDPAVFDIEFVDAMFTFPRPWDTNGS